MGYNVPPLQKLLEGIAKARASYISKKESKKKQPNPARLQLFDILESAGELVKTLLESDEQKPTEIELQELLLGAYLFCIESIATKYRLLNPSFGTGWIFNSGSDCYDALLTELGITMLNNIDPKHKPYYLNKFYNTAFKAKKDIFTDKLNAKNLKIADVDTQVHENIKVVYSFVDGEAKHLLKAIPTEAAIDEKMLSMAKDYVDGCKRLGQAVNPEREQLAEIIGAVCKAVNVMIPAQGDDELNPHFLSRRQRTKMGMLLYVMRAITSTYYLRSPEGNAVLYDLCAAAMNIKNIKELDQNTQVVCLSAFETFLHDSKNVTKLEFLLNNKAPIVFDLLKDAKIGESEQREQEDEFVLMDVNRDKKEKRSEQKSDKKDESVVASESSSGNKEREEQSGERKKPGEQNELDEQKESGAQKDQKKPVEALKLHELRPQICIDPITRGMRKALDPMITGLTTQPRRFFSPTTMAFASIGSIIAAAPGYGSGYTIGYAVSQTNGAVGPKLEFSKVTNFGMTVLLGDVGQYLGYFASNMVVDATMERAFAKVFESLAMLLGAGTGCIVGLVIVDFSATTLMNLCKLFLHLNKEFPGLARDGDPKFIQGLLSSPTDVFSDANKKHLQQISKKNVFSRGHQPVDSERVVHDESRLQLVK